MNAYCVHHNTYDPGTSAGSANQCILGDVCLKSNLSREQAVPKVSQQFQTSINQYKHKGKGSCNRGCANFNQHTGLLEGLH